MVSRDAVGLLKVKHALAECIFLNTVMGQAVVML